MQVSDLYLEYRKEREGIEYILVEGAFVTYKFLEKHCYLMDVFCVKELRDSGIVYELASKVEALAKNSGYSKMLGSVDTKALSPEAGLQACFNQGYKILKVDGSVIWLQKEI